MSEFKNNTFQKLLDKHDIKIIFALGHASFVESFKYNNEKQNDEIYEIEKY